mmetsp:Transcript_10693/g.15645  ORF Transcript_10693/g.15645 Transcript_10693/m.15645 type:complete len:227 (-) Transcript_10693:20-700(-)
MAEEVQKKKFTTDYKLEPSEVFIRFNTLYTGHFFTLIVNIAMVVIAFSCYQQTATPYFLSEPRDASCQPVVIGSIMLADGILAAIGMLWGLLTALSAWGSYDEFFTKITWKKDPEYEDNERLDNGMFNIFLKSVFLSSTAFFLSIHLVLGIIGAVFGMNPACSAEQYYPNNLVFAICAMSLVIGALVFWIVCFVFRWWFAHIVPRFYLEHPKTWASEHPKKEDEEA